MRTIILSKNLSSNFWGLIVGLSMVLVSTPPDATAGQAPVALGSAGTFGVLAGTTVTSTGGSVVNGDLGISPGNMLTGSPIVNGILHLADPAAAQAQADLLIAYNDAAGRTLGAVGVSGNLGGLTLGPGLYKSSTSLEISSGDLTLDGLGDTNAVWIFQMATTLVTFTGRQVILSGGAQPGNIFWQVGSSATIGGSSVFKGTILASQSITMNTLGSALGGRALAQHGEVALDANAVTIPDSIIVVSAAAVTGPYTYALAQSIDLTTRTITVPKSGSAQFYRIRATKALTVASITLSGANVVITYN
jgi:hypothetical protein